MWELGNNPVCLRIKFKNKTSNKNHLSDVKEKYEVATKKCGFPELKVKNAMLR
jgi:hypothetical protein